MKEQSIFQKLYNEFNENYFFILYHLIFFTILIFSGYAYTSNLNELNDYMVVEVSQYSISLNQELNQQLTKHDLIEYNQLRHQTTESLIMFVAILLLYLMPKHGGIFTK